ncbi:MAG: mechanosensitive ion channel family protein [Anaerolineae bacterium]|nr:mechanosensitive ion channel family protein [Anaerolineae bacterium]
MFNPDAVEISKLLTIAAILFGTVIVAVLASRVLNNYIKRLTLRSKSRLDDALLRAIRGPLRTFIALTGVWFALRQADFIIPPDSQVLSIGFFVAYLLLGYYTLYRLILELSDWYDTDVAVHTHTEIDEQVLPLFRRIALILLSSITLVILLSRFDVDVSAFVATLGVTSLAIALAARAVLEDMISGFIINIDRPFRIGDRIELEELNTWGDVQDIGLRSTRILTRDNRLVSVPNSLIGRNRIINHSIPSTLYRVQTHVGVAYGTDIDRVRKVLVEAVSQEDWVMDEKPVEALFLEFQESALLFRVRCWIEHYVETRRIMDKLNTAIYKALQEAEIEIPLPQRAVHLRNNHFETTKELS